MEYDAVMKRIMKSDDNIRNCIVADTEGEISEDNEKAESDNKDDAE